MNRFAKPIYIISSILILISCELITPKNPVFFCKVNGKNWTPKSDGTPLNGVIGKAYFANYNKSGILNIGVTKDSEFLSIFIKFNPNNFKNGDNLSLSGEITKGSYFLDYGTQNIEEIGIPNNQFNFVVNKIDNDLISGTFEFVTNNSWRKNKKFEFTKGQFNNLPFTTF